MSYDTNPPLIPLDTPHDLVRIQASFHAAMLEVLGPKLAGVADPVERAAIQAELEEWETAIFDQAAPNLKLNGLPYTAFLANPALTEPFDEPLDRRLRSLAAEKELIEVQLAERRAATPGAIRGLVADLAERRRGGERVVEEEGSEMDGVEEDKSVGRLAESKPALEQTFAHTLGQLSRLASDLPNQLERASQAQAVLHELGRLPSSTGGPAAPVALS